MRNVPKTVCLVLAMAAAAAAADDPYGGYVQLTTADAAPVNNSGVNANGLSGESFDNNNFEHWTKDGVAESQGPHAGERYYVPAGNSLTTSNLTIAASKSMTMTFAGDELVVAGGLWTILKTDTLGARNAVLMVPNLVMLPGGKISTTGRFISSLQGTCLVKGTSAKPSYWTSNDTNINPVCDLDFVSESANSTFRFDNIKNKIDCPGTVFIGGDASRYEGTLLATSTVMTVCIDRATPYVCAGTWRIANGTTLYVTNTPYASINTLSIANGSTFVVCDGSVVTNNILAVTNATLAVCPRADGLSPLVVTGRLFSAGGKIPVSVRSRVTAAAETFPLLTLAAGVADGLTAEDFDISFSGTATGDTGLSVAPESLYLRYAIETDATTGDRTLYAMHRPIVYLTTTETGSQSAFLQDYTNHWSNGREIEAANDYYVCNHTLRSVIMDGYVFPGASLTLREVWYVPGNNITMSISDFRWIPRSVGEGVRFWSTVVIKDGIVTIPYVNGFPFTLLGYNGNTMTVMSEIRGAGNLWLTDLPTASNNPKGSYVFSGTNTAYTGSIRLYHVPFTNEKYLNDPKKYCVTLTVSDQRNLGGALVAFEAESLTLEDHSLLDVRGSAVFDEPTRGWCVKGIGRIKVASGETVAVTNKQITWCGEFMKEGAGCLVLGGTARFCEEQSETPLAGTNLLSVLEGSLQPADATACDGLAISFATGTGLVLDAAATGDLKTYGLYDVKWNSPISVEGNAPLPVSFVSADGFDGINFLTLGICTVSAAAAETMDATTSFAVTAPSGLSKRVYACPNGDGTVTFACDLVRGGTTILFR